jgi:hypothetical protein
VKEETDFSTLTISQFSLFQNLEQQVLNVRMRFFNLVEDLPKNQRLAKVASSRQRNQGGTHHHSIGTPFDSVG